MVNYSFVIPCYFSGRSVETVVNEICKILKERGESSYEIILVNDGSTDSTFNIIQSLVKMNNKIIGINLSKNFGQANATIAGLQHASGKFVVYSDDDGQTPINELWKLVDKLNEGHDIVFGNYPKRGGGLIGRLGSHFNEKMASMLINKPVGLHMSNFWVARSFVTTAVCDCKNPYPYIAGLLLKVTNNMSTVNVSYRDRSSGESTYTLYKQISLWLNGFLGFSVKPLRVATLIGFLYSLIGMFYLVVVVVQKILYPAVPMGYSSLMCCLLITSGVLMIVLGVIGEYIGRVYININSVPQYVIRSVEVN